MVRLASRRWCTVRGPRTKPSAASATPLISRQPTNRVVYGTKRELNAMSSPPPSAPLKLPPGVSVDRSSDVVGASLLTMNSSLSPSTLFVPPSFDIIRSSTPSGTYTSPYTAHVRSPGLQCNGCTKYLSKRQRLQNDLFCVEWDVKP